jgi:hypothetical protein
VSFRNGSGAGDHLSATTARDAEQHISVAVGVSRSVFACLQAAAGNGEGEGAGEGAVPVCVKVVPMLFTQGINEMQTVANFMSFKKDADDLGPALQARINEQSYSALDAFAQGLCAQWLDQEGGGSGSAAETLAAKTKVRVRRLQTLVAQLRDAVEASRAGGKSPEILTRAAAVFQVRGVP